MLADVIVNAPTDPTKKYFTYLVPKELQAEIRTGQYVQIPWGQKQAKGVIFVLKNRSELAELKPISAILFPEPVLKNFQVELLSWLSWYYHAPMIDCLKAMLPDFPARIDKISFNRNKKETLEQKLILVPTLSHLPAALTKVKPKSSYVVYHHDLPKLQKFTLWQQIYAGETETIIGARSAVFVPFTTLSQILLINEHDLAFKDERSPYYHSLTVALQLAKLTGCQLIIEDQTPSVELFYLAKNDNLGNKFTLKQPKSKRLPTYQIVDMANERKLGNYSLISQVLANYLVYINQKKLGPTLLYLNRKSTAGHIFCRSCKTTTFAHFEPANCPNCASFDLIFFSTNLLKVGQELKKLIPDIEYEIVTEGHKRPIPQKLVTLATSTIFYQPVIAKFAQIAVISADTSLNLADFHSQEATFQFLSKVCLLPTKISKKMPQIIVQTYNPQLPAIKYALEGNYWRFYQEEITQRKVFGYPPFAKLAKLSISHKDGQKAKRQAENLYQELESLNQDKVEIVGSVQSFFGLPQKSKWNIILKAKNRTDFEPVLAKVPIDCTINVDPKDLL